MTRADALRDLLAAVEAGAVTGVDCCIAPTMQWDGNTEHFIHRACHGSVDAAIALTEAMLPGWPWTIEVREAGKTRAWTDKRSGLRQPGYSGECNDNPARALLIAALKALIAQEEA